MASMLVSGKEALQANSDRHLTASWKESMVAAKCFSNTFAARWTDGLTHNRGVGKTVKGKKRKSSTVNKKCCAI